MKRAPIFPNANIAASRCGPHIVWFGEVPLDMDGILRELSQATVLLVVGTSGSVYPAAGFVGMGQTIGDRYDLRRAGRAVECRRIR